MPCIFTSNSPSKSFISPPPTSTFPLRNIPCTLLYTIPCSPLTSPVPSPVSTLESPVPSPVSSSDHSEDDNPLTSDASDDDYGIPIERPPSRPMVNFAGDTENEDDYEMDESGTKWTQDQLLRLTMVFVNVYLTQLQINRNISSIIIIIIIIYSFLSYIFHDYSFHQKSGMFAI